MKIPALAACLLLPCAASATPIGPSLEGRAGVSLNGKWRVIIDPYDNGYYDYRWQPYDAAETPRGGYFLDRKAANKSELVEYDFDSSPTLMVPGDWNSQDDKLFYYEGAVWYRRTFDYHKAVPGNRLFVHFGAANYEADVYLNGKKLGRHTGGFTPFSFEITSTVRESGNSLVVRVDNRRRREGVPTLNTDWWNYGGLTRDVTLLELPDTFIASTSVQLAKTGGDRIALRVQLEGKAGASAPVHVTIPQLRVDTTLTTDTSGVAQGEVAARGLVRWSPEKPQLYDVTLAAGGDRVTDKIGFRTIETRAGQILLNGAPVFLRGISIHEENPLRGGRAYSLEDARLLLGWARELHCNFVRLAHYPHSQHMARLADELGLMVWEEIPVYWTIQWENPETLANAQQQLAELIARDHNRASVVVWSVANETPVSEPRTRFLKTLVDQARAQDGTRLVSAAMEVRGVPDDPNVKIVDDPFGEFTDLVSFNEYVGWYDGLPEKCARVKWTIKSDKPVVISEFGADALQGLHADALTRFSEEYQEDLYRRTLAMLQRVPHFSGTTPWILTDFRSPRRPLPGVQDGWNRKGLVGENGTKKKAFFVLRDFYDQVQAQPTPAAR